MPGFLSVHLRAGRFAGALESGKSELLDIVEGGEKRSKMLAISQNSIHKASAGVQDLTGKLYIADQEPPELHSHDVSACTGRLRHQPIPGLQVPSQSCYDHVGPVRNQAVREHSQGVHPTFQLPDDIFLVAAVVSEKDDFLHRHLTVVGDVEKIPLMPSSTLAVLFRLPNNP